MMKAMHPRQDSDSAGQPALDAHVLYCKAEVVL